MKTMNDGNNGSNSNHGSWLGFSLSPHMKMEISPDPHHHHQFQQQAQPSATSPAVSNSLPTSFYLSSSQLNTSAICYNVGENGGFHSPLSVMPLKSDGSLCIMEALSRSHAGGMVACSSPKLEDFLGGPTMETHQYGGHGRETMALSLDSMYYHHQNPEQPDSNRPHSLDLLQDFSLQTHTGYYSGLGCHPMYQSTLEESKDAQIADCDSQIPQMAEDTMPCLKNWVARHYSPHNAAMEPRVNTSMVDDGGASVSVGAMGCGNLQSLSLSMSPGSQSSCVTAPRQISPAGGGESVAFETKKRSSPGKVGQKQPVHRKSIDTFGQRTSQYRGVTRHRWTGRYEAHLWDNSCKKEGQTRKGRQVYLGGYDMEDKAARAYDLAALKYWGPSTHINFPLENYRQELEDMKNMSRQEYVAHLRRKSSGFSRGASMYRGVTRHHQHGRWQARIGRVAGNKDLYLGTFSTQEEAAEAYDIAAIKFRGVNAVTNFDITRYDVEKIMASNTLLAGELARRNKKEAEATNDAIDYNNNQSTTPNGEEEAAIQAADAEDNVNGSGWKMGFYQSPPQHQPQPNAVESLDHDHHHNNKPIGIGNYRNQTNATFSMALQNLIGIDSGNPGGEIVDESGKIGRHFSNPSSLVTSLNSSREGSPDKTGSAMLFAKSPSVSWFPSAAAAQLRPAAAAISMAHLPLFAAWNDT